MFASKPPIDLSYTLTRAQFTQRQEQLARRGIDASGDEGTIKSHGVTATYKYEEPTLAVQITEHPLLLTQNLIKGKADEWFGVL